MGAGQKRPRSARVEESSPQAIEGTFASSPPLLTAITASLGAVLAVLFGYFAAQMHELYLELGTGGTDGSSAVTCDQNLGGVSSDGRGVAPVVIDWDLEAATSHVNDSNALRLREKQREVSAFVKRNEPFVCRQCMSPPSLGGWWDVDSNLMDAIGSGTIMPVRVAERPVVATSTSAGATVFQRIVAPGSKGSGASAYLEKNMTASDFFASYRAHRGDTVTEHLYAAQIDVASALPGLLKYALGSGPPQKQVLDAVGTDLPMSHHPITLYLGAGERVTQLHYDSLENVVCLASGGSKSFSLYDPASSSRYLYVDRARHGNGSPVSPSDPGRDFDMAAFALPSFVTLQPGDCLYVPVYWYHTVTSSEERTVTINWWRSPDRQKMGRLEGMFCDKEGYAARGAAAKC